MEEDEVLMRESCQGLEFEGAQWMGWGGRG
jgi:hypothetical protein